ncbi:MAG: Na+:solute symporter [candidate division KSB1 bacterium]|nr:Na+:solute symporter [candidate division KSB1 bacterium]MDZ7276521.1 Na+:solute symporter [candidate division KSB1 bacterium]MDZ7286698.1 Na+:solute symporter [candidate division KSB1 bacterium]MDZ7300291.1 Na+:solute symporter [candidate division KSB1 bacterium]MDZ7307892.1 Na+:solute symporter [candidate division KSB1 bacterium]
MPALHWLDVTVIVVMLAAVLVIAAYYSRHAGQNTEAFFLSGRNLPWYVAGTAMVATTFAADTPLAVTELVARNGIGGNWLWWNMAIGGMLTVFFFAKLWRRAGIMTDVEFVELRYSGRPAAVLRGFRALYLGLFMNAIVMGWVHKAMEKIFKVTLPGSDPFWLVVVTGGLIALYAATSGLPGTARTDSFQFVFAMLGCIVLAVLVVRLPQVGGLSGMTARLSPQVLDFFPHVGGVTAAGITGGALSLTIGAFLAYIGVQWWSSWYPGADPGGGGYIAQRMMACRDERQSVFATLWFNIAHYTVRPWPWILVALAALLLLPRAENAEALQAENPVLYEQAVQAFHDPALLRSGAPGYHTAEFRAFYEKYENTVDPGLLYPKLMRDYLPPGLLGLLIAVFLSAYMSTIASQISWGTSYLINDFYRRFIKREASEKHYVLISRFGIALIVIISLVVTRLLTTISGAWEFIINASAGMGAMLILRWFWWRINAWSEIAAMIAPLVIYPLARAWGLQPPLTLYPVVLGTTLLWLLVTFLTPPVEREVLRQFYRKVHPGGRGWKPIADQLPDVKSDGGFGRLFVCWISGVALIYGVLFGLGSLLFGKFLMTLLFFAIAAAAVFIISKSLKRISFETAT